MEITKMITLSTEHIKESTSKFIDDEKREFLVVYKKGDYGWYIYVDMPNIHEEIEQIPSDLADVIRFAINNDCGLLCLDCDGPTEEGLQTYEW